MKILITGPGSALGTALVRSFAGHEVVALGRTPHPDCPTIVCDLRDGVPALPRFDVCLHLAFLTDPKTCTDHAAEAFRVNVLATIDLLAYARRFVFVSTGYVYGFQDGVLNEDRPPEPSDAYAAMKLEAERAVAGHENAVVLRYFFPYGPGTKPNSVVNRLIRTIEAEGEVDLHEGGGPRTNPIYISDLVEGTRRFCVGAERGLYNVAGSEVVSIRELAEAIGAGLGKRVVFRPTHRVVKDMIGGVDQFRTVYRPAVSLRAGLADTIRRYQEERGVRAA